MREISLFKALEDGEFADVKRDPQGGRGFEGVFKVRADYFNPFFAALREGRLSGARRPAPPPASRLRAKAGGGVMIVRPYGDTRDDGVMQFSFTLPIAYSVKAADVGKQFLEKLGFRDVGIAECKAIDPDFTFYVAYGRTETGIDPDEVKGDYLEVEEMDYYAINALIKEQLGRKLSVVGAAIESDAHTVGIDAIINMKGFAGNYGFERYPEMDVAQHGLADPLRAAPARRRSTGTPTPSSSRRSSRRRTSTCRTSPS